MSEETSAAMCGRCHVMPAESGEAWCGDCNENDDPRDYVAGIRLDTIR